MKLIQPSFEILVQEPGYDGMIRHIERCGRTCYRSGDKITDGSAERFVNMIKRSGHTSVLEHGAVYLQMPYNDWAEELFEKNPYSRISAIPEANVLFISTNYRVIVENGLEDILKYMVDYCAEHERRISVRFTTQIAISREFNRHRVNSPSEESTRYVNYSKDRFGNEISINLPTWIHEDDLYCKNMWKVSDGDKNALLRSFCSDIANKTEEDFSDISWWLFANLACEYSYMKLIGCGWKPQQARTVLPLDTNTELVHTAFASDWKHFFELRVDNGAGLPHPDASVLAEPLKKLFSDCGYI